MTQQPELLPMAPGEYLKQNRIKRKLSLEAVARAVKLDEKVLTDIEHDRTDHIALVYRNGYIRVYARYLEIPEDQIRTMLVSADEEIPVLHNIFSEPPKRDLTEKWLRASSYVLASLLIGTLAWQFTHEAVRLSQNGSRLQTTEENAADIANITKQTSAQEFGGSVNASIASLGVLHEPNADGLDTAEQAWAAVSQPLLPDGESSLQISVSADSWVEISDADGQELEMDLLRGGSDRNYHGKPPFRLLFGHAAAVRLVMDGEPVDLTAYTRDNVAQLTWPQGSEIESSDPNSD